MNIHKLFYINYFISFKYIVFLLFQLWAFDQFLFVKRKAACVGKKYPRLLRRMNIKVGDSALKTSLEKNVVSCIGFIYLELCVMVWFLNCGFFDLFGR